ncbi:MAG: polysaccharide export protein [Acidobacteria bacterium]|nr:MAG: polysaccharide export protein [Acidobacteriota bacterium]
MLRDFAMSSSRSGFCCSFILTTSAFLIAQTQPVQSPEVFPSAVPATAYSSVARQSEHEAVADSTLRLGIGDLLEFSVYNVPELSTKTRVGNNGDIYLPLIDYVHVAGLTTEEAQGIVEKRLSDGGFLNNPHVTLFIDEYASQGASVLGEVGHPGVYPVLGDRRLFDLISAAGGFTDKAGRSIVVTHRNQPDKPVTVPLTRNLSDSPDSNIAVFPGDTISVRRADVVYVVGEVNKPSGFLMDTENLTVLKAIALAGGTSRTARLSGAKIIRNGPAGMTQTSVQLKRILQAKAPDMPLQAEDILFVPSSAAKQFTGRTFEAAMQAATAVSIVAVRP